MEESRLLEADSRSTGYEISWVMFDPKVNYRVHKSFTAMNSVMDLSLL
jgi:hypothetical protein